VAREDHRGVVGLISAQRHPFEDACAGIPGGSPPFHEPHFIGNAAAGRTDCLQVGQGINLCDGHGVDLVRWNRHFRAPSSRVASQAGQGSTFHGASIPCGSVPRDAFTLRVRAEALRRLARATPRTTRTRLRTRTTMAVKLAGFVPPGVNSSGLMERRARVGPRPRPPQPRRERRR